MEYYIYMHTNKSVFLNKLNKVTGSFGTIMMVQSQDFVKIITVTKPEVYRYKSYVCVTRRTDPYT